MAVFDNADWGAEVGSKRIVDPRLVTSQVWSDPYGLCQSSRFVTVHGAPDLFKIQARSFSSGRLLIF